MKQPPSPVKSASRVLDLLELFSNALAPLGVSTIAKRLQLPKSSVCMLLGTLERRGFITSDENRRFQLHPSFSAEARAWIGGSRGWLIREARKEMEQLVESTRESCFLSVLEPDWHIQYIEKLVSPQDLRIDSATGVKFPPNFGSSGIVLLAFQRDVELDRFLEERPLRRSTPKTICDPRRQRQEVSIVRSRGYAIAESTHYEHVSSVAAPIRNNRDEVTAAIGIGAPTARFPAVRERAIAGVLRAASLLSSRLAGSQA